MEQLGKSHLGNFSPPFRIIFLSRLERSSDPSFLGRRIQKDKRSMAMATNSVRQSLESVAVDGDFVCGNGSKPGFPLKPELEVVSKGLLRNTSVLNDFFLLAHRLKMITAARKPRAISTDASSHATEHEDTIALGRGERRRSAPCGPPDRLQEPPPRDAKVIRSSNDSRLRQLAVGLVWRCGGLNQREREAPRTRA